MLRVVQIIPDDRDMFRNYELPEPYFGAAPTALFEGFAAFPLDIEVHVIACVRRNMPAPQKLAENIFYHQVLVSGGYRRTLFIEAVCKVRKKIRELKPDIVHGQGTEDYPGLCAAFSGYPNCITLHGNMRAVARRLKYRPFPQMVLTALAESIALRKTDAVICNSSYTERCVGQLNKNKIRIPNAARSSFFDVRTHRLMNDGCQVHRGATNDRENGSSLLSVLKDSQSTHQLIKASTSSTPATDQPNNPSTGPASPVLLCSGTVVPYKNQIGLIHALDSVAQNVRFKLVFAGRCPPGGAYARIFLKAVGERPWCEYAGQLEIEALQELLGRCSGVIHPTLEDSFGLVVAEAQAAGVPVAASNIGGLPDLIVHGKTGLLFNPQDPSDIRGKAMQLLDHSAAEELAGNARIFAEAHYRPQVIVRKHIEFYKILLDN